MYKIVVFFISIALFSILIYLIFSIWFRGKRSTYLKLFFAMGLMYSIWALFNGINLLLSEELYIQIYPIVMIFACILPHIMLRYMLYFTESKYAPSRSITLILTILPALDILLLLTNPWHREFIAGYDGIHPIGGRLFIIHAFISYIPLLITLIILFRYIVKNVRKSPSLIYIGLAILLPLVLNVLYTFDIFDLGFDITPFAFLIMFGAFTIYSIRLRLFDVTKIALTSLFTSLSDSILVIDSAGHVVDANPSFINAFPQIQIKFDETTIEDVIGFMESITVEKDRENVYHVIAYFMEDIHNAKITVKCDNELYYYLLSKDIIKERGQHAGFIITLTDVSNYQRIENMVKEINEKNKDLMELKNIAESASKTKSDFLAKMSHEIRTPMNFIMGLSELILRKEIPQDVYENVIDIHNASANLISIINDILDFSKIESGKMEIIENNYMFSSLINDLIAIIRMRMIEKSLLFIVNIDCSLPASLIGDEVRIRQILLNLLSNAVKYTENGYISLTVSGTINNDIVTLTFDIKDSGIGIREEDIEKLFGDFIQLDLIKNKGIEGTGLGLAIARNLCQAMGGNITVQSEYGKGSTFTITLSQRFDHYEPFAKVENTAEKSVLLYEARQTYAESVISSLKNLGIRYKSVENTSSLYAKMENYPYVFVSSFLYESINPVLKKLERPPTLVLLADITETFIPQDARLLTMPVHTLSLAYLFNDIQDNSNFHITGGSFIAPDAKVLIVDDITANLKVTEGLLSPYEMQIEVCKSGRKALAMVSANKYDLVLMDHMMPEMDGLEAASHIRAMEGEDYQSLPIIALTANAVTGMREMFIQNGMNDFLAKPIETVKLDAVLEKWIPKEKQKKINHTIQAESANDFISMLRTIPELSVDKALSVAGGSALAYERTVKLTAHLLPENIDKLNALIKTDLQLYAIEIHGIKGVLNNIGAYSLGEKALQLETLSKAGDIVACQKLHPAFDRELIKFSESMLHLLDDTDDTDKVSGDRSLLPDVLSKIKNAAEYFDSALALEVLSSVNMYLFGEELDELLADMTHSFERFDFDRVDELINKLDDMLAG